MKNININQDKTNRQRPGIGGPEIITNAGTLSILTPLFVIACLLSICIIPLTSNIGGIAHASTYTLSLSTSGDISLDVDNTGSSARIATDNLTVVSTCPSGYTISISGPEDPTLYLGGDSSNNSTTTKITPANNTVITGDYLGSWGYSATSNTLSGTFNTLPSDTTMLTSSNTATSAEGLTVPVYYGVSVKSDTTPGTYKMSDSSAITYAITTAITCTSYTVQYNANGGTGSMPNQIIAEDTATALDTNTFTAPDGKLFNGWNTAADGSGTSYADGEEVTNLTTVGGAIILYAQWKDTRVNLYDAVAAAWENEGSRVMTNDTNTSTGIKAAITATNSGVFKYNPSVFGASSDAANTSDIYFYRGILDSNLDGTSSTYGSAGDGVTHPNYVILDANGTKDTSDTCWRIVRTTGSGGVKMIYNGKWTGSTCANATTNAQAATSSYGTLSTYRQIVRVGYTYNSTYATNTSKSGTIAQIFGTNSTPSVNNTRSTIKAYIEDTWYPSTLGASGSNYTSILEASAGYCNDRTMNTSSSWTSPLAESTTIASTYGTSGQQAYYFGAYPRNADAAQSPSLTCGNKYSQIDRSTVDLYRYVSGSAGIYNELKYPAALLTADEASFAGSGSSTASNGSASHYNSYLRSGSDFWLLSPGSRISNGRAYGFYLTSDGYLDYNYVYNAYGVRPAISLTSGTLATSGSGTAADPWVVEAPKTMQSVTSDQLAELMPNEGDTTTLIDARDGNKYSIAKINGAYWMTQNLRITGTINATDSNFTTSPYGGNATSINVSEGDLNKTITASNYHTYTAPRSHLADTTDVSSANANGASYTATDLGAWYNYCAASAGQVCSETQKNADQDICPAGWRLPTNSEQSGITSYASSFSPVYGGYYNNGSLSNATAYGRWWSALASAASSQYVLNYNTGSLSASYGINKRQGLYVRCVKSS